MRAPDLMKKVKPKVDVRVTVKIAFVPEATLTAHVGVSFKNATSTVNLSRQPKKKGKGSVENWRDRPVRARVRAHRHFQRTLPGELCRTIILARRVSSAATVGDAQGIDAPLADALTDVDGGGLTEGHHLHERKSRTRKRVRVARKMIMETKGSHEVGLLREHLSLSFASHLQIASVISKRLPLQSVDPFLFNFGSFRPAPLQKQGKRNKKKGTTASPIPAREVLPTPLASPCDEKICKTPVGWVDRALKHAFGEEYVMLKRCEHPDEMYSRGESHSDLDIVVVDCVLARGCRVANMNKSKRKGKDVASYAPVQAELMMWMPSIWHLLFGMEMPSMVVLLG